LHGKTESVLKLSKISRWFDEVSTRSIIASSYALACIFSPVFLKIKARFKEILKHNYIYTDGYTPQELNTKIKAFATARYFVEDDLTKQDAQTSHDVIMIESMIYKYLGLDATLCQFYFYCHHKWRWKGNGISGIWDAIRLTGQVTTSLGNSITNLIVHNRFTHRNSRSIILMLFLGDDNIVLSNQFLSVMNHGSETKRLYNMISKITQRERVGGFLSMVMHSMNDMNELCPHIKRMRHRFAVCNYTFSKSERVEKLESRCLSYCFMLGSFKDAKTIAAVINSDVKLSDWFHVPGCLIANSVYDEETELSTYAHLSTLFHMLDCNNAREKIALVPTAR
jgi:hypothetical protein